MVDSTDEDIRQIPGHKSMPKVLFVLLFLVPHIKFECMTFLLVPTVLIISFLAKRTTA